MFKFNYFRKALQASKFTLVVLAVLFTGLIASALVAVDATHFVDAASRSSTLAQASPAAATSGGECAWPDKGWQIREIQDKYVQMRGTWNPDQGTVTVWNTHPTCGYRFSLLSFKITNENPSIGQIAVDRDEKVVPANSSRTFSVDLPNCRYQIDLLSEDGKAYIPQKLIRAEINSDLPICNTVPDLKVSCTGTPGTISPGGTVTWEAFPTGGTGSYTYSWTGNGSFPNGATGKKVPHRYLGGAGQRNANVTVTSGGQTATAKCSIQVVEQAKPPVCKPATQTVRVNEEAVLNATGGNGSFSWSGGGNPRTAQGATFKTRFATPGTKTVTVTSNGLTDKCTVIVESVTPQLSCTVSPSSASVNANISFTANGGNGTYSWVSNGGNPSAGNQRNFVTRYGTAGTKTATVTSGGQTATCNVVITKPPVQNPPFCSPSSQKVKVNQNANFTAGGGNGSFSWAGGGSPATGNSPSFTTKFASPGTKTVTVTSNGLTDQCIVIVEEVVQQLVCSPANQAVNVDQDANFVVSGGSGGYTWTGGGSPATGNGSSFTTRYGSTGSKTVTVRDSGNRVATCNVNVEQTDTPAPICSPSSQDADLDENVFFSASGGDGSFIWSAPTGSDTSGSGSTFDTRFDDDGTHVVTVTSNGKTDTCIVHIDEDEDDLFCSPSIQDAEIGEEVVLRANGGTGGYRWDADEGDADPDHDTGSRFEVRFFDEGTHDVELRDSDGNRDTCRVRVEEDDDDDDLECTPSRQTVRVGEEVDFRARGGTGDYEWDADDGSPRFGFGRNFETTFDEPGTYTVELESNGERDTCRVTVEEIAGAVFCSPSTQAANVNDFVTFQASGGDGSFSWSTSADGTPTSGSGSSFGTRFLTPGTKFVTVRSNGRTGQCIVNIGTVLGASTIVTGPAETAAVATGLGFLGALAAYGAVYRERSKKFISKLKAIARIK